MPETRDLYIHGVPDDVSETDAAIWRSKIIAITEKLLNQSNSEDIRLIVTTEVKESVNFSIDKAEKAPIKNENDDELSVEQRASRYQARASKHSFDKLVFETDLQSRLDFEVDALSTLPIVHNVFNYKVIKSVQRRGLVLGGEPGTGKTAVAHAIANKLDMPILTVTSADIESKFHGEGTKNLRAVFHAASRDSALLHLEEADGLCSQRFSETNTGSEQATNSLRNQLFSCLDEYPVPVICTTNAVKTFDKALQTRLRYIHIPLPDSKCRQQIWEKCLYLPGQIRLEGNVDFNQLAKVDGVCGREIVDAVEDAILKAVLRVVRANRNPTEAIINQQDLLSAIQDAQMRRQTLDDKSEELTPEEKAEISEKLRTFLSHQSDGNETGVVVIHDSSST